MRLYAKAEKTGREVDMTIQVRKVEAVKATANDG